MGSVKGFQKGLFWGRITGFSGASPGVFLSRHVPGIYEDWTRGLAEVVVALPMFCVISIIEPIVDG